MREAVPVVWGGKCLGYRLHGLWDVLPVSETEITHLIQFHTEFYSKGDYNFNFSWGEGTVMEEI